MLCSRNVAYFGLVAMTVVLVGSLGVLVARAVEVYSEGVRVGRAALQFTLPDLEGQEVSLASLRGQTVVLCFSSARGDESNRYLPRVTALARQYAGDERVKFLAIEMDELSTTELAVQAAVSGQDYPTLLDAGRQVARQYAVRTVPTFCVIDATGIIRYVGPFDDNVDERQVKRHYLAEAIRQVIEADPLAMKMPAYGVALR